jgi:hypothetical protein
MNNIQELIERLRQDAKAMEYNFPAMAERINKAIAALESMQAPLQSSEARDEIIQKVTDDPINATDTFIQLQKEYLQLEKENRAKTEQRRQKLKLCAMQPRHHCRRTLLRQKTI